ncbi:hypothetical protein Ahy_A10g048954 [Arachis hypogaea]|uniref:Protein FAR1-RELATED SEQUENCE n=1 Tax=Arachis hypogaea TaxID=3818 RepID=A0A445B6C6_ARAHY|nr:hypothetical protein Ahy_A10g048954 [Arachis hypogaea]
MKWATTYLREYFYGYIRTTSQYKRIHLLLKNYVDSKTNFLEFMHKFEEVLSNVYLKYFTIKIKSYLCVSEVHTLRCSATISTYWKFYDVSSQNLAYYRKISSKLLKLISKVHKRSDTQAMLFPTLMLIGDYAIVKSKYVPKKKNSKGEKRDYFKSKSIKRKGQHIRNKSVENCSSSIILWWSLSHFRLSSSSWHIVF